MNAKKRGRKILAVVMLVSAGSILCFPIIAMMYWFYADSAVNFGGNIKVMMTMMIGYFLFAIVGVWIFGARAGVKILIGKKSLYWTSFWNIFYAWSVMALGSIFGSAILWFNGEAVLWQKVGLIISYILAVAIVMALVFAFAMARAFARSITSKSLDSALID